MAKSTSAAGKALVIVESPTKAKTINKYLGKDFVVKASMGHVRDLPDSASEIPEKYKDQKWVKRLGVNVDEGFEPLYIVPPSKKENVKALKAAMADVDRVYLATDEDREGESISWHLREVLKPKVPVHRMVFSEITKEAIQQAIQHPRQIDENLVRAQETRRIVDRLFGYEVSPLLWKKMALRLSAGRVQSVAVRLLVEREIERMRFKKAQYWDLSALFNKLADGNPEFSAELTHVGDNRVATGKDFDPNTGLLRGGQGVRALNEADTRALAARLTRATPVVTEVEEKPYASRPSAPFVTSTLQQEANRKLRFSAKRTMSVAQQLYENGFITYMRTDSTTLSDQALTAARSLILQNYGKEYLPSAPRTYKNTVKNAQEAHEAIRPAGDHFTPPDAVRQALGLDAFRLYDLIWKRTVASQMADARGTFINVTIQAEDARFRASGKTIEFPGFLRAYVEGSDDPEADLADRERILPKLTQGEKLGVRRIEPVEHWTQPPARFTEGSLIKELERLGIGRPSTWSAVVDTVLNRGYAFQRGTALIPTFVAFALMKLLKKHFTDLVDYNTTARLEDDLDAISRGEAQSVQYLSNFYFGNGSPGLKDLVEHGEKEIDPRDVCGIEIGTKHQDESKGLEDKAIEIRLGRYGLFLTDGERRASLPEGLAPDELTMEKADEILSQAAAGPQALGADPETGLPVYAKSGRFGPYVQLGDAGANKDEKPKMASLLPGMTLEGLSLDDALGLLSLPRAVGHDPAGGEEIIASNGRYGPYVKKGTDARSLPPGVSPLDVTLEQALILFAEPKQRGRRTAAAPAEPLRDLGKHPESGSPVVVKPGRYGPYVTDGETNASLRKDQQPESLSLDEALDLLQERKARLAETGGKPVKRGAKRVAAQQTAFKKTAVKKAVGKKAAAKKRPVKA